MLEYSKYSMVSAMEGVLHGVMGYQKREKSNSVWGVGG